MSVYEDMIISALRYALGRQTYIVEETVNYIIGDIMAGNLGKKCLFVMKSDIEHTNYLGMDCDEREWQRLLGAINEHLEKVGDE